MSDLPAYWPMTEDRQFPWPGTAFDTPLPDRARFLAEVAGPNLVAVARTAAWLHGIDTLPPGSTPMAWPAEFNLQTSARGRSPDAPGVRRFRWNLPDTQTTIREGIRVTTLERTLADCARRLPRLEAAAAADQLLRAGATGTGIRHLLDATPWPLNDRNRITEVLDFADPDADSPMESWCRRMIADAELPTPRPQARVDLPEGAMAFLDLGFPEYRVGAEYDGRLHHSAEADLEHDRHRRAQIARAGWAVLVFRSDAVIRDPAQMLTQLMYELRRRGWRPNAYRAERCRRRIRYIAMMRRLEREHKGLTTATAPEQ